MGNQTISAIPQTELDKFEQPRPFQEFPKWLYHTDGRSVLVNSEAEELGLGHDGDWHPSPGEAQAEKARRDEAATKATVLAANAEGAANTKKAKGDKGE